MSEHYYSEKPSVKSDKQTWSFTLRNRSYTFTSDSGVFSKKEVDFGSRVLIEAFEEPEIDGDFLMQAAVTARSVCHSPVHLQTAPCT